MGDAGAVVGAASVDREASARTGEGAENVISASGTGFFCASVTVTASRIGNGVPAGVDCVEPTPGVSLAGLPARFEREKLTGVAASLPEGAEFSLPDPPEGSLPETAAVAVNDPAVLFAVNAGELATPLAPVVAVAWVPPPVKLALAAAAVPHALEAPEPSVNVTVVPATGLPSASSTLTCSGSG